MALMYNPLTYWLPIILSFSLTDITVVVQVATNANDTGETITGESV